MRKLSIIFILCAMATVSLVAQESFSKINLSGFRVYLTQSDVFSIEVNSEREVRRRVQNGVLHLMVLDQTGRVPFGTVTIGVKDLSYLNLHNSELIMDSAITVDELQVAINSTMNATLKVHANSLSVNVGAGAQPSIEGTAKYLNASVGAGSRLNASRLIADQAEIHVMGHSRLTVNAKEIVSKYVAENSRVTNVAE